MLQRSASSAARSAVAPPVTHAEIRSPGQPRYDGTHRLMDAHLGHDFGRVSLHEPATSSTRLPEYGNLHRLHQGSAGETGCDVSIGTPQSELHSPSPCYRDCTARHEALHVADLTPCCKKANQAYKAATTDDKKNAIQEKMNQWSLTNQDYLECRAYGESVRCANEFLAAHCAAPKSTAPGTPSSSAPATGSNVLPNTQSQATGQNQQSPQMLAGERMPEATALDNEPSAPPANLEICCSTVKEYARVQGLRRDNFCSTAKKGLTACPF